MLCFVRGQPRATSARTTSLQVRPVLPHPVLQHRLPGKRLGGSQEALQILGRMRLSSTTSLPLAQARGGALASTRRSSSRRATRRWRAVPCQVRCPLSQPRPPWPRLFFRRHQEWAGGWAHLHGRKRKPWEVAVPCQVRCPLSQPRPPWPRLFFRRHQEWAGGGRGSQ